MGAMPLLPATIPDHVLSVSGPHGLTAPIPVTTTLRIMRLAGREAPQLDKTC